MKFIAPVAVLAAGVSVVSGATSLCDKYTTALLTNNTAANQATLLTLLVNTALIGNYSNPATQATPAKNAVTGILAAGKYNGTDVSLVKYFDGSLNSTNVNGVASSVSFLDGGGATPLMASMPANDTTSNQYTLVTHLYQIFGSLLGCTMQNATTPLMSYQGNPSMSEVHRFMNLDRLEMNYFIQEVGSAATSFGVTTEDATAVGTALNTAFNYRCSPATSLGGGAANASQSICVASSCPLDPKSNCTATAVSYPNGTSGAEPVNSTVTPSTGATSSSSSSSSTGSKDGASTLVINAVGALALAAAGLVAVGI